MKNLVRRVSLQSCCLLIVTAICSQAPVFSAPIDNLQVRHWTIVSSNTIADVNPCPNNNCSWSGNEGISGILDDWTGGAFATEYGTHGGLIAWGGGHSGYYGNEVYIFDVGAGIWRRLSDPVNQPSCNLSESELQDGSPCAPHSYDYVEYHPPTNSFVKLGSSSDHHTVYGTSRVHLFDLDTRTWRRGARKPTWAQGDDGEGASTAYDPNRGVIWYLPSWRGTYFSKYDPQANGGAGQWTEYANTVVNINSVSAIDPVHDLFVTIDGRTAKTVVVHDLKNPGQNGAIVSTSGDKTAQNRESNGFEWDPVTEKFVAWVDGSSVYTLTPPDGNWRTQTWAWERIPAASTNSVSPSRNSNGTFSHFRYVPSLNAFIVVTRVNGPVYMYKLSDGVPDEDPPDAVAPNAPANLLILD